MKRSDPEDYNYDDIKQYTVELNEVTSRMEDQKFVLTNGIVVGTKSLIVDFINFLNFFSHNNRKLRTTIDSLESNNKKLAKEVINYEDTNRQLKAELKDERTIRQEEQERTESMNKELEKIREELELLKKTTRKVSQARTIQK